MGSERGSFRWSLEVCTSDKAHVISMLVAQGTTLRNPSCCAVRCSCRLTIHETSWLPVPDATLSLTWWIWTESQNQPFSLTLLSVSHFAMATRKITITQGYSSLVNTKSEQPLHRPGWPAGKGAKVQGRLNIYRSRVWEPLGLVLLPLTGWWCDSCQPVSGDGPTPCRLQNKVNSVRVFKSTWFWERKTVRGKRRVGGTGRGGFDHSTLHV